ncbi:MAG: aquaporin Z [Prevotellaceae bacterium]|jgi:aquaporin Z|nr:aquaporin Z [Prevotellaceae bacterium]
MSIKNKMIAECIGTFWLVLGGCGTAIFAGHAVGFAGVSLAFGLTVVTMAYGIGHISGAHLNPAVSFGVWVNGRMKANEMLLYWVAQVVGAIIAAALMFGIAKSIAGFEIGTFAANGYGDFFAGATNYLQTNLCGAFAIEAVLTFIFLLVILGATDERANTKFAGLAIGLCLTLIHLISIPLTNTSVNPARSISQAIFSENALAMPQLWLFIAAPLVGAALAGLVYKCYSCNKK